MRLSDILRGFRSWVDREATPERVERIADGTMAKLEQHHEMCPFCGGVSRTNEWRRCGNAGYIFRARHVPCPANCEYGLLRIAPEGIAA